MDSRLQKQIAFLVEIDRAKQVIRQTSLMDGSRQENDAEHSWHIAIMAVVFAEYANAEDLDILRIIKMLLIHDLVEIDVGDVFLYDENVDRSEKHRREHAAAKRIFNLLPPDQAREFLDLWTEFEACETAEARFAKALDGLQPVLQGFFSRGWCWKTHHVTVDQVLKKKESVRLGSERLWKLTRDLVLQAEERGYFPSD